MSFLRFFKIGENAVIFVFYFGGFACLTSRMMTRSAGLLRAGGIEFEPLLRARLSKFRTFAAKNDALSQSISAPDLEGM